MEPGEYLQTLVDAGKQVTFTVDLTSESKKIKQHIVDVITTTHPEYVGIVDEEYFDENPIILICTDLEENLAEKLKLPKKSVIPKKRVTDTSDKVQALYLLTKEELDISQTISETTFEDTKIADVTEIKGELFDETFHDFQNDISFSVREKLGNSKISSGKVTDRQLNSIVTEVTKSVMTRETLVEAINQSQDHEQWRNMKLHKPNANTETPARQMLENRIIEKSEQYVENLDNDLVNRIKNEVSFAKSPIKKPTYSHRPLTGTPRHTPGKTVKFLEEHSPVRKLGLTFDSSTRLDNSEKFIDDSTILHQNVRRLVESSSESEDEYSVSNPKLIAKISGYNSTLETVYKIPNGCVPIWHFGESKAQQYQSLENFIADIKRFANLGINVQDSVLIFSSLNKSNRSHLMNEIPQDALSDLDKFVDYLNKAFGRTQIALREQLNSTKREVGESAHSYLTRVMTLYYKAKKEDVKTPQYLADNKDRHRIEIDDIFHHFYRGLNNDRLRSQLLIENVAIDKLADTTKRIENAYESSKIAEVNKITTISEPPPPNLETDKVLDKLSEMVTAIKFNSNQNRAKRGDKCHKCGFMGHWAKDCWTSKSNPRLNKQPRRTSKPYDKPDSTQKPKAVICFKCKQSGHYANKCNVKMGKTLKK